MIRFSQTFGAHAGRVVEFGIDVVSFGRMPTCDVVFDPQADLDASGHHAEVRRMAGGWHVLDAQSRNGTWLNGQKVQRAVLSSGDELEFGMGGPRFKVEILAPPPGQALPGQVTGPMTSARADGSALHSSAEAAVTPVPRGLGAVNGSAATVAVMATPVPAVPMPVPFAPADLTTDVDPSTRVDRDESPQPKMPLASGVGGHAGVAPTAFPPASAASAVPAALAASSPAALPALAPGTPAKQYGQHTVGLMIDAAIAQQADQSRPGRSTDEIRAIAGTAPPPASSGGLKWAVALLMLLLGLVLVAAGVVIWKLLPFADVSSTSNDDVPQVDLDAARTAIATQSAAAMYVLVEEREGVDRAICAAFSVRPDLLATTAACVLEIDTGRAAQASHFAVPNGGGGRRLPIVRMGYHPNYVQGATPSANVGIVHLAVTTSVQAPMASMAELGGLVVGSPVFVFGFSRGLENVAVPVADLATAEILSLTAFDGTTAPFATSQLLRHRLPPSPGTRGSPIFDASGRVVGVSAGAYGVRIDLLASLLAGMQR